MKRLTAALALVWALIATATAQVTTNPDITGVGGGGCIAGSACTGTTITATTQFIGPNGSAGTPTYRGTSIAGSGMFFGGDNSEVPLMSDNGTAVAGFYNGGGGIQVLQSLGLVWPTTLGSAAIDLSVKRYAAKQLMISGDGTGATTNAGVIIGYSGTSGLGAIWSSAVTPGATNFALSASASTTELNSPSNTLIYAGGNLKATFASTAGSGPSIIAGTAADNTGRALSISQTWTDGTTSNIGIVGNFDMGATGTATGKLLSLQAGAAGTTEKFYITSDGNISSPNFGLVSDSGLRVTSSDLNTPYIFIGAVGTILESASTVHGWGNVASQTRDTGLSRISAGVIGVGTGAAGSTAGTLRAAALAANGSDFTITAANVVSPTSPNRTITISYGGTTYYLAAKTTND